MTATEKRSDFARGYSDRMAGYYDKWYRYNRRDNGRLYEQGVLEAQNDARCPEQCNFIECEGGDF